MSQELSRKGVLPLSVDAITPSTSRAAIDEFVDAVGAGFDPTKERRTDRRKPILLDVIAVPLDSQFKPVGDPFLALTRDISDGGISMFHTERVSAPYLLVKVDSPRYQKLQAVVQVVRSRRFYQFAEISGRFVLGRDKKPIGLRSRKGKRRAVAH